MRTLLTRTAGTFTACIATGFLANAQATVTRVSLGPSNAEANGGCFEPSISGDGRYVAFHALGTNLVAGDTNSVSDVFVRDVQTAQTTRVSLDSGSVQANGDSYSPAISSDGRFVAFESFATNLVAADTNSTWDVFVRDRQTNLTTRVSLDSSSAQANGESRHASISGDGRYVSFTSLASNLVAGDTNSFQDVFVRDRTNAMTVRASVDSSGAQANLPSFFPALSSDGHHVVFESIATNLVASDTNGAADVFSRNLLTGTTARVSVSSAGAQSNAASMDPSVSSDGRYVAFYSLASNLASGDTNGINDVFVRDTVASQTTRVSLASSGAQPTAGCYSAAISGDGRYVAFYSSASNLVAGDTNTVQDVFVRDLVNSQTLLASTSTLGALGDAPSYTPSLSADGSRLAFASDATNLVASDTNASRDVFLRDAGVPPAVFCTAGTTTHGCVASISAVGAPSVTSGSGFTINVGAVEGQKQGILFYGIDNSAFAPLPWGPSSSFLCVKQPTQRSLPQNSGGTTNTCSGALALDWNAFIAANPSALGNPFTPGQHVYAQAWFRDPPSPKTTMLSNGLDFVVQP